MLWRRLKNDQVFDGCVGGQRGADDASEDGATGDAGRQVLFFRGVGGEGVGVPADVLDGLFSKIFDFDQEPKQRLAGADLRAAGRCVSDGGDAGADEADGDIPRALNGGCIVCRRRTVRLLRRGGRGGRSFFDGQEFFAALVENSALFGGGGLLRGFQCDLGFLVVLGGEFESSFAEVDGPV